MSETRALDDAGRLLTRLIRPTATPPTVSAPEIREHSRAVVAWALDQGVAGLLLSASSGNLAPEDSAELETAVAISTGHHLRCLLALERLADVLDRAGARWVVMKGPVLVETGYRGISRPYTDLDLLVSPSDFAAALEALEAAGARLEDRNWHLAIDDRRAQLSLRWGSAGIPVDLHWHLVNRGAFRDTFHIQTDEMLSRQVMAGLGASRTDGDARRLPTLDITDRVIHYALHGALSGGHRLIWLADLALSISTQPPDWDLLVARCREWRVELPVAVSLARTERTLGPIVPEEVVPRLVPTSLRRGLVGWLAPWEPAGRLPGGGSVRRGLTQSLAGTLVTTCRLAAVRGAEMVGRLWDGYPHWLDPDDPASMTFDSGGDAGRASYLATVG